MMRRLSAVTAGLFAAAVLLGAGVHAFAADEHESHTPCTDGLPLTHVDACGFHSDASPCELCLHSAAGGLLDPVSVELEPPSLDAASEAPLAPPLSGSSLRLALSRGPPALA